MDEGDAGVVFRVEPPMFVFLVQSHAAHDPGQPSISRLPYCAREDLSPASSRSSSRTPPAGHPLIIFDWARSAQRRIRCVDARPTCSP